MKKALGIIFIVICVLVVVIGTQTYLFLEHRPSESDDIVVFDVEPGHSFKRIAHNLKENGLITSETKFALLARLTGQTGKVRVGEYAIRRNMLPREILGILTSGKSIEYVITVPEGYNKFEIADIAKKQGLNREEFLKYCDNPELAKEVLGEKLESLEGYLFPETYYITKFTGSKGLVRMMVERFIENFKKVHLNPAIHMNRHELVILASIIEKETGASAERNLVSSVFHNRLHLNMKLQTDPTVIYGLWLQTGKPVLNIRKIDLQTPNRYNTYTIPGLPAGPISNPGLASLEAAANPAQSEYLYFVSRNDGTTVFSKDYGQHSKAVNKFQVDPKGRAGKSWHDLNKKKPTADVHTVPAKAPSKKASKN